MILHPTCVEWLNGIPSCSFIWAQGNRTNIVSLVIWEPCVILFYKDKKKKNHGNLKEVLIRTHFTSCWYFKPVQSKMRVRMVTQKGNGCHLMPGGLTDSIHHKMFFLEDMLCLMLNITKKGKTSYSRLTYFPCPILPTTRVQKCN